MHSFLIILQAVVIFVSIAVTILLLHLQGSLENKFMFVTALCVDVYSIGYLREMMCTTREGIYSALINEYCGLSFEALLFALFVLNYCHVVWPRWIQHICMAFTMFVLAAVIMNDKWGIYYSSFTVSEDGLFPHAVSEKNWLYYCFMLFEFACIIVSAVTFLRTRRKVERKSEKKRYLILFIETLVPVAGLTATVFMDLGGWDPSPLILSILVTSMTITLKRGHFFDVLTLARDDMFQNVGNAVIVTDSSRSYLDSNAVAENIFPSLRTIETGRSLGDLEEKFFGPETESYFKLEDKFYHSFYSPLYEKGTLAGYIVTVSDITDIRKQMDDMRKLKEQADAANEAKSAFLANMSHEIRTPLNAIIGMSELSEKEKSDTVIREYLDQIKSAGKILLGIVNDVHDFSKAESGKLEITPVEFDTAEFFNSIVNVSNMRIGEKPVDLLVDIDPDIPKTLYGDDVHIRQIFMNLLSNADKFTQTGHILLTVNSKRLEGRKVKISASVEDTGMGIKSEDKDKLFNAFQQLDSRKNRKIQGSGLGLAIFAQLVHLMGGEYGLESRYGRGSVFSFDINIEAASDEPVVTGRERQTIKVPKSATFMLYGKGKVKDTNATAALKDYSKYKILVVDDNKVNVKVLSAFLKQFQVVADSAYSGQECIDKVKANHYDLIFMDHMMPEMDGVECTTIIRAMDDDYFKKVPIIACTANVVKGVEDVFKEAGMNDFVPKPIQLAILQEKLSLFLG